MRLYEIASEFRALADTLEETGGELDPGLEKMFADLSGSLEDKSGNIVRLIRELTAQADAVKAESTRLAALARSKENAAARLKQYLLDSLQLAGVTKMDLGVAKIGVQKAGRPAISWDSTQPMPEAFCRVRTELDGQLAYDAWKAGTLPDGFTVKVTTFLAMR